MTEKKIWFITGAGRGMGTDIAKAALAAGHAVVATGRNPDAEQKVVDLQRQIDAFRDLSTSLAYDEVNAGVS